MQATLIRIIAKLISLLPLSWCQRLGTLVAQLLWLFNTTSRRVTEFNIAHCYPDLQKDERRTLARQSVIETGKQVMECAWIWNRPVSETLPLLIESRNETLFTDALESNDGLIIVSPHMGNWELCMLPITQKTPFTYFYRAPRNPSLGPLLIKWRAHLGGKPALLDSGGIRTGMKVLKNGGTLGILPDQEPDRENGVFAPLFGQPALTMTLLPKLAARSKANVIYIVSERREHQKGWVVHYLQADPDITHADPVKAAAAINRDVERCIEINPAQYLWDYKRFSMRPDGTRRYFERK